MSKNRFSLDDEEVNQGPESLEDEQAELEPEDFESDEARLVEFLKYAKEKRKMTDFMEETFKAYEKESVDRQINKEIHQHDIELAGSTPWHKAGHIGPLMHEYLNMVGVEAAFVSGLQHTKSSLTKTVQQRVDEINTLLRMVGGFNRQIKASFSRSAVVYLEQEDPKSCHRENVIFTINLSDIELRYRMDESANDEVVEDGRTLRRLVWDEAVNTLAEIVSNTGMKPKYVKNDKNNGVIVMRQHLLHSESEVPDEFFDFELKYIHEDSRDQMTADYVEAVNQFDQVIEKAQKKMKFFLTGPEQRKVLRKKLDEARYAREFYVATNPDPREMDNGLVFSIKVNTLKDYSITKDRMQFIMTRYILALSRIAVDKSSDQQVNTVYQYKQAKAQSFQSLDLKKKKA